MPLVQTKLYNISTRMFLDEKCKWLEILDSHAFPILGTVSAPFQRGTLDPFKCNPSLKF